MPTVVACLDAIAATHSLSRLLPHSLRRTRVTVLTAVLLCAGAAGVHAADAPDAAHLAKPESATKVTAFSTAPTGIPPAPWQFETLPKKQETQFTVVVLDGVHVLKADAPSSYGNLVHDLHIPVASPVWLSWKWRVDQLVENADLTSRTGDDAAARLCVFFDYDASKLPFGERASLRLARSVSGVPVPTETLCYVWDNKLPLDTVLNNAFTRRVRLIVLQSGADKLGQWMSERHDIAADYLHAFADEAGGKVPDITGVGISADSDNTRGHGVSYFGDVNIAP